MDKTAIIGPKDAILGFKALGLTPANATNSEEALEQLQALKAEEQYAIIFIMEELAEGIREEDYDKLTQEALPAIIPVPGPKGSTGYGMKRISKFVEQAVGSDIFGNN